MRDLCKDPAAWNVSRNEYCRRLKKTVLDRLQVLLAGIFIATSVIYRVMLNLISSKHTIAEASMKKKSMVDKWSC